MPRSSLHVLAAASLLLCVVGCTQGGGALPHNAMAPAVGDGDGGGLRMMRNVADPNAPFAVLSRPPQLQAREPLLDIDAVPLCAPQQLHVWEATASVNGDHRSIRYTIANVGAGCKLAGFPAITLLGTEGQVLGSIALHKVSQAAIEATLQPQAQLASESSTTPSAPVLLVPKGQAGFDIGWTSGPNCQQVDKIAVAAPGTSQSVVLPRQLTVCEDQILLSAVSPDGGDQ